MDHDDRSDKIVTLARSIIQQQPPSSQTYSLKTMALVALLSAATAGSGSLLAAEHYRPLNRYEKTELRALISYAAKQGLADSASIEQALFVQFDIQSLDELTAAQMQAARQFLQKYIR